MCDFRSAGEGAIRHTVDCRTGPYVIITIIVIIIVSYMDALAQ